MVTRIGATLLAALALLLGSAASAGADPTQHFTGSFDLICGGNTLTVVDKPGSSNVITVNGQPSNSVSLLFGLAIRVDDEIVFDSRRPRPIQTSSCATSLRASPALNSPCG
jgi:hypothetical protein